MDFGAEDRFSYKASYAFHNEETCGPRRISSPIGKKIIIPYDHCLVKRTYFGHLLQALFNFATF